MKKLVKRWSDSLIITFDKEDQKIHNIQEGDIVDLSDMQVIKKEQDEADMNISNVLTRQRRDENEQSK